MEQEGIYAKKAATARTRTLTFEDFIEVELVISNDLLFSREGLKDYRNRHDMNSKRGLMTACAPQTPDAAKEETEYTKQSKCHICDGKHDMDKCTIFNKQNVEGRSKTLAKKKLCYGCYMPITADLNSRTCSNRRMCKICNQKHPTGLHGYASKRGFGSNSETTSSANPVENDNLGASSVPVVSNSSEMDIK